MFAKPRQYTNIGYNTPMFNAKPNEVNTMTNKEINTLYAQAKAQQDKSDKIIGAIASVMGLVMAVCTVCALWAVRSNLL